MTILFSNTIISFLTIISLLCSPERTDKNADTFLLGNEALIQSNDSMIVNKKIGLITNSSGVLSNGVLFLDSLNKNYSVTKIFTPEHGLRVDDNNENFIDDVTGITVVSLYGNKKKPDAADAEGIDVFVYDLQDVSARFYTFINTMYYCMESAVENDKEFIVCDRPIIPNGNYTDGFLLDESEKSFVGLIEVPVAYGMTCGELALYINEECFNGRCRLNISKMQNYKRNIDYTTLNLPWIKPSPNMYFPSSAVCYLGTCLLEGTNFAEGRGSERPFEYIGAPYCDGKKLAEELSSYNLAGVSFDPIIFIPQTITSPSNPPKYVGETCEGVFINVTNKNVFEPVKAGIAIIVSLKKLFSSFSFNKNKFIDKLAGTKDFRVMIERNDSYDEIVSSYSTSLNGFKAKRMKYLMY